ncbi:MAG: tetratricopeptide repeat protein [Planctomycetes bacterium]|nr:tetratricopeptide repeat protein [Planctomycetota bacterium]
MKRSGRIHLKVLFILVGLVGVLGAGVVVVHYVQKSRIAARALTEGQAAFEAQRWTEAARHLKTYLSKYPDDVEVLQQYADAHLAVRPVQAKNIAAAIAACRRLLRHRSGDADLSHQLARLYSTVGDHVEAAYICRQRLEAEPDDPKAMLWLGRALSAQHKRDEAVEVLTALVEQHPDQVRAYALLSMMAAQGTSSNRIVEAKEWMDRAVKANPNSAEALAGRARLSRVLSQDEPSARRDLEAADDLEPDHPSVLLVLAEEWTAWGRYDRAANELALLERIDPTKLDTDEIEWDDVTAARFHAAAALALRDPTHRSRGQLADEALAALSDHRRMAFLSVSAKLYLADDRIADAEQSLAQYGEALRSRGRDESDDPDYVLLSAQLASANGRHYETIQLLRARDSRDRRPEAAMLLAQALVATGQSGRARETLLKYVELAPREYLVVFELARLLRHHDWRGVLTHAANAFQLRPTLAAGMLLFEAKLALAKDDPGRADIEASILSDLTAKRKQFPENVQIRGLMAGILANRGSTDEALAELQQAIRECDNPLPAEMQRVDLLARTGRMAEALSACRSAVEAHGDLAHPRIRLADLFRSEERFDDERETLQRATDQLAGAEQSQAQQALIRFFLAHDDRETAVALAGKVAADLPGNVDVRLLLLAISEFRRDEVAAQRVIDEVRAIEGDAGIRWKYPQARQWLEFGHWRAREREIIDLLEECVREEPGWEEPALALGALQERLGQLRQAEQTYRLALTHKPDGLNLADRLVGLLKRQQRYLEAEKVIDAAPQSPSVFRRHRIDLALGRGDHDQAIRELEEHLAVEPQDAAAGVRLARLVYAVRKDRKLAWRILDKAAAEAPDSAEVVAARVAILHDEGEIEQARKILDEAVGQWESFSAYWLRAKFLVLIGQQDEAERDFVRLTTLDAGVPAAFGLLGEFYQNQGRPADARAAWEAGLERNPDHVALQRMLLGALVVDEDPQLRARGLAMLRSLRDRLGDDPELMRIEASMLLDERTVASRRQGVEMLEQAVQRNPTDVAAHLQLIELAMGRRDFDRAQSLVSQALATNPQRTELRASRIAVELKLGNSAAARELARTQLERHPRDVQVRNRLAEWFHRAGDLEFAQTINDDALHLSSEDELANVIRAAILTSLGRPDEAREHLQRYVETPTGTDSVMALVSLSARHTTEGDFEEADRYLTRAAQLAPSNDRVEIGRLRWLAAQERFDQILARLSKARAEGGGPVSVLLAGALILASSERERDWPEARNLFEQVCKRDALNVAGYRGLAAIAHRLGDVDRAIEAMRKLLELQPQDAEALNNVAWMLAFDHGDAGLREAEVFANRGVARDPNHVHLLDTRGVIFSKLGRLEQARQDFEKCIRLARDKPATRARAWLHLAQALHKDGRQTDRVRSCLQEAQDIDRQSTVLSDRDRTELVSLLQSL